MLRIVQRVNYINNITQMSISLILDKIIKPQFRSKFNNWETYAKPIDLFGLDCINQIYNTKGTKKLHINQPIQITNEMQATKGSRFLGETSSQFKPSTTTYKFYHGSSSLPKQVGKSIFQFKNLSQIKLARPLNHMTITFVDNWLQLGDNKKYQQAVLNCLRSLSAKLQLTDAKTTQMKTSFDWKNDWKLSKPVRMDKAGEDLYSFKPNLAAIQKQQRKKQIQKQKLNELQKSQFAKQLKIFKDFKIN